MFVLPLIACATSAAELERFLSCMWHSSCDTASVPDLAQFSLLRATEVVSYIYDDTFPKALPVQLLKQGDGTLIETNYAVPVGRPLTMQTWIFSTQRGE